MEITILGSGSVGNAIAIRCRHEVLMIDAGFSGVELVRRLGSAGIDAGDVTAMLISHEHNDHILGARTFCKRHGNIPAYANALTAERLKLMNKSPANMYIFHNGAPFEIGPFSVEAFSVCHDAVDPVGFIIRHGEKRIGIATDLGYAGKMVPLKLCGCDLLVLESNHDPDMLRNSNRPPHLQHRILGRRGHLSNRSAAELVPGIIGPATKHLVLAHLSDDCNCPNIVTKLIREQLRSLNREDIRVCIARQDCVGETIMLE